MAGRPLRRQMIANLHALAVQQGVDVDADGQPLEYEEAALAGALAWIRGAHPEGFSPTVLSLSRHLGVSRPMVYDWLTGTPERKRALALAREDSAATLADQALELLDNATIAEASLANSRANFRKWLASVYDRAGFGQQTAPAVAINVAHMHLAAHAARKALAPASRPQLGSGDSEPSSGDTGQDIEDAVILEVL